MRALILNRFNLASTRYHEWAQPGARLVLVTSESGLSGDPDERARQLAGYERVEIFDDYDENPAVEDFCITQFTSGDFDRVLAMSESDILRAARIREALGVAGQSVASALAFRDKVDMKNHCLTSGVPTAKFAEVRNVSELREFIEAVGFPVVVKPRREAGSIGVRVLRAEKDLNDLVVEGYFRGQDDAHLIAEDYIEHDLYHIDGLIFGGRMLWSWTSHMSSTLGHLVNEPLRSVMLAESDPMLERTRSLVGAALDALPTPDLAIFHAELFDNGSHGLLFNEIAARVGGAKVHATLRAAFGTALIEWYVRQELNSGDGVPPPSSPRTLGGFTMMRPLVGILREAPEDCPLEGIEQYQLGAEIGDRLEPAEASTDSIASFVVLGKDTKEIHRVLDAAEGWFTSNLSIEPL